MKIYKGAPTDGSAWIEGGDASRRLLRGGSWNDSPGGCRSAFRLGRARAFFGTSLLVFEGGGGGGGSVGFLVILLCSPWLFVLLPFCPSFLYPSSPA